MLNYGLSYNFMTNAWDAISIHITMVGRNIINICIKYGFDILIISSSYGGHRQHMTTS